MRIIDFILSHIADKDWPFLVCSVSGGMPKINKPRIIEGVMIAVVTALISTALISYVTLRIVEYRISQVEVKVDRIITDIYRPTIPKN